jgi:hypothetical protein
MSYITNGNDPQLLIASGAFSTIKQWNVFGLQPDADTGAVPMDVWGNNKPYTPPTSAQTMEVSSTSTQDIGALRSSGTITAASQTQIIDSGADFVADGVVAGDIVLNDSLMDHSVVINVVSPTILDLIPLHHGGINEIGHSYRIATPAHKGAFVVRVDGLDAMLSEISEFVILNGTSVVNTVNQYSRINFCQIQGSGIDNTNNGDITFVALTDTTTTNIIPTGKGQSTNSFRTIPQGYNAYITNITASLYRSGAASDAMAQIAVYENLWAGVGFAQGLWLKSIFGVSVAGEYAKMYVPYMEITEGSDVWMRIEDVSDNNSIISITYDVILIEK